MNLSSFTDNADVLEYVRPVDQNQLNSLLEQNSLNWEVQKQRLYLPDHTQTDFFGLVRIDTMHTFQACTNQYTPLQNRELMETALIFSDMIERPISKVKTLDKGAISYITFKGRRHEIAGLEVGDTVQETLNLINSHDGSKAFGLSFGHTVLSCLNGQTRFDRKGFYSVRHTISMKERLKAFSKGLPRIIDESDRMIESYKNMIDVPVTRQQKMQVFKIMTGVNADTDWEGLSTKKQNILKDLDKSLNEEMSYKGQTRWGLLNGVTHFTSKRAGDDRGLKSKLFGKTAKKELTVFNYLSSLN